MSHENTQPPLPLPRTDAEVWDFLRGAAETQGCNRALREAIAAHRTGVVAVTDSDRQAAMYDALNVAFHVCAMLIDDECPAGMMRVRFEDRRAKLRQHLRASLAIAADLVWP